MPVGVCRQCNATHRNNKGTPVPHSKREISCPLCSQWTGRADHLKDQHYRTAHPELIASSDDDSTVGAGRRQRGRPQPKRKRPTARAAAEAEASEREEAAGLDIEKFTKEAFMHWNIPVSYKRREFLVACLNRRFDGNSDWHFVTNGISKFRASEVIDRLMRDTSKLPFLE